MLCPQTYRVGRADRLGFSMRTTTVVFSVYKAILEQFTRALGRANFTGEILHRYEI